MDIYADKVAGAEAGLAQYRRMLADAKKQQAEKSNITGIEKWIGYQFESSSSLTPEFAEFRKDIKKHLKKVLDKNLELIMPFGSLHFSFSGFIKNNLTGKYVYFSSDDVRGGRDGWYNNLLIRTAKDEKDYSGGSNCFTSLPDISARALMMTL
jgi:hypothetical protein